MWIESLKTLSIKQITSFHATLVNFVMAGIRGQEIYSGSIFKGLSRGNTLSLKDKSWQKKWRKAMNAFDANSYQSDHCLM